MKKIFLTAMFVCLVVLGARDVQAHRHKCTILIITTRTGTGLSINSIRRNMIRTTNCTPSTISCIYLNTKLIQDIDSAVV